MMSLTAALSITQPLCYSTVYRYRYRYRYCILSALP